MKDVKARSAATMLKAAFVGFGRMGITHFSILNTHPDVEVVAISDPSAIMQAVLKQYLSVKLYSDFHEMIEKERPDLVVISTPPDSHAEILKSTIKHGIHFFVEKPLTLTATESKAIAELSVNADVINQVGYVNRFCETFSHVKKMLNANIIGDVKSFSSEMYSATVVKDSSGGWRGKRKAGGGCLYEMASHAIDLAVFYFGAPKAVKGSVMQQIYSSKIDDLISTTLIYDNSITGRITVNWSDISYRKPGNIVSITGTKGKIIATKYSIKCYLTDDNPTHSLYKGWNTIYLTDLAHSVPFYLRGNEFTIQLYDFIERIQNKQSSVTTCSDAATTDYILDAIMRDAEKGRMEPLVAEEKISAEKPKRLSFKGIFSRANIGSNHAG